MNKVGENVVKRFSLNTCYIIVHVTVLYYLQGIVAKKQCVFKSMPVRNSKVDWSGLFYTSRKCTDHSHHLIPNSYIHSNSGV